MPGPEGAAEASAADALLAREPAEEAEGILAMNGNEVGFRQRTGAAGVSSVSAFPTAAEAGAD